MTKLHVLAHVHAYPPRHNAGAEWMLHSILTHLATHYDVEPHVVVTRAPRRKDSFEGVHVEMVRDPNRLGVFYEWADVVITHLDATARAMRATRKYGKPLVHLVHNDRQLAHWNVLPRDAQLVVANSQWICDKLGPNAYPVRMVVYPPVWVNDYQLGQIEAPAEPCVALLNLTEAKGGTAFYKLAWALPDVKFLGVLGSYGEQVPPPPNLANVEVWRNQPDVRRVYERASIVVMPSTYESWGRVAVEAGAAGRPVIAAPTPGLRETEIPWKFIRHDRTVEWATAIRGLLRNETAWLRAARTAHERARQLEAMSRMQLAELAGALHGLRGWDAPPLFKRPAPTVT